MNIKRWRQRRALDEHVGKALRHAERLSTSELLDTADQAIFSIGQAVTVLRTTTDPEYRFQIIAEAKANADVASVMFEALASRQELSLARRQIR